MASFRLNKVAKDFNVGIQTLVEYLAKKGHQVEQSPNTKISEEQYELLATAFDSERKVKEEADKIELMSAGSNRVVEASQKADADAEPEEVVIKGFTTQKKVTPKVEKKPVAADSTPAPQPQPEHQPEPEPEPEPVKAVEVEEEEPVAAEAPVHKEPEEEAAPVDVEAKEADYEEPAATTDSPFKVVGTVDLSAINQRMRPDKKKRKKGEKREPAVSPAAAAKPKTAKTEAPAEAPKPAPAPAAVEAPKPAEPAKPEPEFIQTQYQKLEGPKVLDKIDLSQFSKDGKQSSKRCTLSAFDCGGCGRHPDVDIRAWKLRSYRRSGGCARQILLHKARRQLQCRGKPTRKSLRSGLL